jgi:hypothetical protein
MLFHIPYFLQQKLCPDLYQSKEISEARQIVNDNMEYWFILVPISLGILVPTLLIPWLSIDLLGHHTYSPLNILIEIIYLNDKTFIQSQNFSLLNIASTYYNSYYAVIFSITIYIGSISFLAASLLLQKKYHKMLLLKLVLVGGIFALAAGVSWMYAIETFKNRFEQEAASTGGLIGEEWKGKESMIINRIIMIGPIPYFVIGAGIIAISSYIFEWKNMSDNKKESDLAANE